jgi:hypothetical protein
MRSWGGHKKNLQHRRKILHKYDLSKLDRHVYAVCSNFKGGCVFEFKGESVLNYCLIFLPTAAADLGTILPKSKYGK